jgi:protein-disulfide isomerase
MEPTDLHGDLEHLVEKRSAWFIPGAIIAAGLMIAVSVYVVRTTHVLGVPAGSATTDHLIGNPSAPVVIVEYADIDSSYAKSFQATMEQLMTEYGASGKVAWVYRHFPLVDTHQYSEQHAEAAECATSLGKPDTFWRFIDMLQSRAPANQEFDPNGYDDVVSTLGLDAHAFDLCMTNGTFATHVRTDIDDAIAIGAEGSPYSVVVIHGQKPIPLSGALPYAAMKKILDSAIASAK